MSGGIGSVRRDVGEDRVPDRAAIPTQRTAADAYRVSDDQLHRARLVVARNSDDPRICAQLLDMLGLISANPDQPPPVGALTCADCARPDPRLRGSPRQLSYAWCGSQRTAVGGRDGSGGPSPHRLAA